MRGFQCHYYVKDKNGNLTQSNIEGIGWDKKPSLISIGNACWSSLARIPAGTFIYITEYETEKTKDSIKLLISLINKITPCSIVTIENKNYIEYKTLETYDQNIIILNFIRNLWNKPGIGHTQGAQPELVKDYTELFFEALNKLKTRDALTRLTKANKEASINYKLGYGPGHSNVHGYNDLKIKNTESLLEWKGNSTRLFLTT